LVGELQRPATVVLTALARRVGMLPETLLTVIAPCFVISPLSRSSVASHSGHGALSERFPEQLLSAFLPHVVSRLLLTESSILAVEALARFEFATIQVRPSYLEQRGIVKCPPFLLRPLLARLPLS